MRGTTLVTLLMILSVAILGAEVFPLREATDIRWDGIYAHTADNCELVFWADASAGDMDVYAQKFHPSGQTLWPEPVAVVIKPGDQDIISVIQTSDHSFIIIYREYEIGGTSGFWIQKITSNGHRLWGENGVEIAPAFRAPIPVANASGGAYVLFQQYSNTQIHAQYLDALGNQLWPSGGIPIVTSSDNLKLEQALSDGEGGVIVNYTSKQNSVYINRLLRIDDTGAVIGPNPLMQGLSFPGDRYQIMRANPGQYILHAVINDVSSYLGLARIDNLGNLLTPQIVTYPLSSAEPVETYAIDVYLDGGLAFAWKSDADTEAHWSAQRFSESLVAQWADSGVEFGASSFDGSNLCLKVGSNDLVWIAWDTKGSGEEEMEVRAQVLSASGVPAWSFSGKSISQGNGKPCVISYPDRGMFIWNPVLDGNASLRRQVINSGGASFLEHDEEVILQWLHGPAFLNNVFALNGKFLSVWMDQRGAQKQIYYQLYDANMETLLETNGRALYLSGTSSCWLIAAQQVDANSVAILSQVSDGTDYCFYLQQIDGNGDTLYPGEGIEILSGFGTSMAMGCYNGEINLNWRAGDPGSIQLKGQRIVNGQKMWGDEGRVITTLGAKVFPSQLGVQGRYWLWNNEDFYLEHLRSKALLVDANGDPAPGWHELGVSIIMGDYSHTASFSHCGLAGDDLIAFIGIYNGYNSQVVAQRMNPAAERLWGQGGIATGLPGQTRNLCDAIYDNEITCVMSTLEAGGYHLRVQKLSPTGEHLWSEAGKDLASGDGNFHDAKLLRFANGSYACVFSDDDGVCMQNNDIHLRNITAQGEVQGEAPTVLCSARYQQKNVRGAAWGNQALLAWNDDRAGVISYQEAMTGIWGTRITSGYTSNDDPAVNLLPLITVQGNHPNPFNLSTIISFDLKEAAPVKIEIFNTKGQLIRVLVDESKAAGAYDVAWNGKDNLGRDVSSGVYLYKVQSGKYCNTKKMILMK